jgi:hypothetical protein
VAIDWTERQSARVKMRAFVCRILRKHGYPPDMARTSDADSVRASRASGSPGASHFENLWDTPVTAKLRSGGTSAASTSRSRSASSFFSRPFSAPLHLTPHVRLRAVEVAHAIDLSQLA